jgi:hypothetical protein
MEMADAGGIHHRRFHEGFSLVVEIRSSFDQDGNITVAVQKLCRRKQGRLIRPRRYKVREGDKGDATLFLPQVR